LRKFAAAASGSISGWPKIPIGARGKNTTLIVDARLLPDCEHVRQNVFLHEAGDNILPQEFTFVTDFRVRHPALG
jgi:hypothetical protein